MGYTTIKINDKKMINMLSPFLINDKCCVAGGFFKDYYTNKKCNDIDIYCLDSDTADGVKTIFNHCFKSDFESENVARYHSGKLQIDLVTKIYGDAKQIISQFDFTICKFAVYKKGNDFYAVYCNNFFVDLHNKIISTEKCKMPCPLSTFKRLIKYVGYGYSPSDETLLAVAMGINQLDEEQINEDFYLDGILS